MPKTDTEIKRMMQESGHPVLKRIRKQLIIEIAAFAVFLFVYYDFFDGHRKPLYANLMLVTALLFAIIHNIMGYVLTKRPVAGNNIKQSLTGQLSKIKVYAILSIASRVLVAAGLLIFFTGVIRFNAEKYWLLAAVLLVFIIQIALLTGVWIKRIRQMKGTIDGF